MKTLQDRWLYSEGILTVGKKHKNARHREAVSRKTEAALEMSRLGLTLKDDIALVGFVFTHLDISHITYLGLMSINHVCQTYAGVDICVFSQHITNQCVNLLCPIFNMNDLMRWNNYPLITTSIGTTIAALASNASAIYYYAFDPEFIDKHHRESNDILPAFCDPRVKVLVRHESHKQLIEKEFGIEVCNEIIPDCNVEKLIKLVLTEMKGSHSE